MHLCYTGDLVVEEEGAEADAQISDMNSVHL